MVSLNPQSTKIDEKVLDKFLKRAVLVNDVFQLPIDALKAIIGGVQKTAPSKLQ